MVITTINASEVYHSNLAITGLWSDPVAEEGIMQQVGFNGSELRM